MKKLQKDTRDMVLTGVTMGVGARVITGAGGDASGISAMSSQMSTMGMVSGAGATMRMTKQLMPKGSKKLKL